MSSIVLRVPELLERVAEMKSNGCDYVRLEFYEAENDEPAFLHFDGYKANDPGCIIDYEELEDVPFEYLP